MLNHLGVPGGLFKGSLLMQPASCLMTTRTGVLYERYQSSKSVVQPAILLFGQL